MGKIEIGTGNCKRGMEINFINVSCDNFVLNQRPRLKLNI